MKNNESQFETRCVHAGTHLSKEYFGVNTPIHTSTSFEYLDAEMRYPRMGNLPNQRAVIEKLCSLEEAEDGLLFASGIAAISATLLAHLDRGDELLVQENIYGGTYTFLERQLKKAGVRINKFSIDEQDQLQAKLTPETKMIYVETPANPLLDIVDLRVINEFAKENGLISAIDNTFATPVCQVPASYGFDLVIHSGTKYLGGHSDLIFGVVVGRKTLIQTIKPNSIDFGAVLDARACYMAERSMKTLSLRVERQCDNAMEIAGQLAEMDGIERVLYPGLPGHKGHDIAKKQMCRYGAMLSFDLSTDLDPVKFQQSLSVITPAVSLGGIESLISAPSMTSHRNVSETDREKMGITNQTLRLSVGIESWQDLLGDIEQAVQEQR